MDSELKVKKIKCNFTERYTRDLSKRKKWHFSVE